MRNFFLTCLTLRLIIGASSAATHTIMQQGVTFTTVGDQFYFCRPHESFGMTGVVPVNNTVSSEQITWSAMKDLGR